MVAPHAGRHPFASRAMPLLLAVLVLAVGAGPSAGDPLLIAVVPDTASGVEGFAVSVGPAQAGQPRQGDSVTDNEGTFVLPALSEGVHWFASDPDAWRALGMPEARPFSGPRLADDGDDLAIVAADGSVVDAFAWGRGTTPHMEGRVPYRSEGLVYQRNGGPAAWTDTDHADDWIGPRVHRVGQSSIEQVAFDADKVTLYASPDASHAVLTGLLATAQQRVALHVYGLRSSSLTDAVVDAAARGVEVHVLVTKSPVGLTQEHRHETAWALDRITAAGGHAWLADNERYDYHHLKVLVVDDAVAVQSENWVPSGVPADPTWGNRGWGAVVHDAEAASWFAAWMAADRAAWDTEPFDLHAFDPTYREPVRMAPRQGSYVPIGPLVLEGPIRVQPFVSPDHTGDPNLDPVAAVVGQARDRLLVQQLDLSTSSTNALGWRGPDVLLTAVAEAASRGAAVRVQAAEPFSSDDAGNAQALSWLQTTSEGRVATRQGAATPVATLHNKGIVADDVVVLGSMNGNHNSRSENREAGLIIHSPGAAAYFAALFAADWGSGGAWVSLDDWASDVPAPAAPTLLVGVLLGALWCIRRRGSSWPSS